MNGKLIAKVVVNVLEKGLNVGLPLYNNWKQNKMIKDTIAKEVAEQLEEAIKNR